MRSSRRAVRVFVLTMFMLAGVMVAVPQQAEARVRFTVSCGKYVKRKCGKKPKWKTYKKRGRAKGFWKRAVKNWKACKKRHKKICKKNAKRIKRCVKRRKCTRMRKKYRFNCYRKCL